MSGSSRLSSLLVRDGLIGVKRMEQAFQRQVIYGGALDTILLEMGAINEDRLSEYLSLASGLPPAERGLLDYFDPRAVQLCPREYAEEYRVAPVAFDGDALRVLVTDPVDLAALEALATRISAPIQPFVIPEFRFNLLVERLFGVPTPPRYLTLAAKQAAAQRPPPVEEKVIVEDMEIRRVSDAPRGPASRSVTGPMSTDLVQKAVEQQRKSSMSVAPVAARVAEATPASISADETPTFPKSGTAPQGESSGVVRANWRGGDTMDPKPIEPKVASGMLLHSEDRDAIFAVLVRGVRSRTRYAAVLAVQGEQAYGRVAIDGDALDSTIGQVAVILENAPSFRTAISSASPYIGPVATGNAAADAVLARMGGVVPPAALLLPIAIRGRVIALVYAHRGADTLSVAEVAEVLSLAGDAGISLSKLILKAKTEGYRKAAEIPAQVAPVAVEDLPAKKPTGKEKDGKGWSKPGGDRTDKHNRPTLDMSTEAAIAMAASIPLNVNAHGRPISQLLDEIEALGPGGEKGFDEALRRPEEVLALLKKRLPGKLWVDRYAAGARPTRASQHGPLLALTIRFGERAAPLLADLLGSENRELRYYATLSCAEVRSVALVQGLVSRVFDQDFGVRAAAIDALLGYPASSIDGALEVVRTALHGDSARARAAAHALGELRDVGAIPDLIAAVDRDHTTAEEARRALVLLTKQDFGTKGKKWRVWWDKNKDRPRIEWMLDGLAHAEDDVRLSASEELKRLTGEYFGYHYDLPKREREESRLKWIKWWEDTGRRRFMRDGRTEQERPTALLPKEPSPRNQ